MIKEEKEIKEAQEREKESERGQEGWETGSEGYHKQYGGVEAVDEEMAAIWEG